MDLTYENYLAHYGIKGMKWGVRRKEGPDGLVSSGSGRKDSEKSDPSKEAGSSGSSGSGKASRGKKVAAAVATGAAIAGVAVAGAAIHKRTQAGKVAANLKRVQEMSKMSAADLYLSSQPSPTRTARRDSKVFGQKGAERVARNRDRGMSPKQARKEEAMRQGAAFALKAGLNVATSSRRRK